MKVVYFLVFAMIIFSCKESKESNSENNSEIEFKKLDDAVISSGKLFRVTDFPSVFIKPRNVDVWLPENYSKNKKYAVLYMHDGQMLFDSTTTWNKQEWKVDEWASKLMIEGKTKEFIVVAPHNISDIRWNDYFPQKAIEYLSDEEVKSMLDNAFNVNRDTAFNADNYLKFITQELKPYIDSKYAVFTERASTFITGSSMGGLISMYAVCEYPEIFGGAACISTHWPGAMPQEENPIPMAFFNYMRANIPSPANHKFYFDFGTETLDQYYPQYEDEVNQVFMDKGYSELNFRNLKFDGMDHSENSWNQRLDIPLGFLLKK